MRKWNTILSVLMLLIFMIHGIMGSFMLNGVGSSAGKLLAWIGVGILVVHTVIGVILTVQSLQTAKQSGKMYLKQNAIFWARRASGMAILILLLFHIGLFGKVQNGTYILFPFTTVKMVTQLLFVAAIFVHIFINIRPTGNYHPDGLHHDIGHSIPRQHKDSESTFCAVHPQEYHP